MYHFHQAQDRPDDYRTAEGLQSFLNRTVQRPDVISDAEYDGLNEEARASYNRRRVTYASGGITIATPSYHSAVRGLHKAFAENSGHPGQCGVLVSGDSHLGKTTILKALMKDVYRDYGKQFPQFERHDRIPVVYVEVPPKSSSKTLMQTFADFFGLTVTRSENERDLRIRVLERLHAHDTQLVAVDELHRLMRKTTNNEESLNALKSLHDLAPATFLYAGINVSSQLSGENGQQLAARQEIVPMRRFNWSNQDHRKDWNALIRMFESALPLRHHQPGMLDGHRQYLWERTAGSLGSLSRLLFRASLDAFEDAESPEIITRERLDAQRIDFAAESLYAHRNSKPAQLPALLKALH